MRYVPSREASRILGVHPHILRAWAREGRISYIRTEGNQRRYDVDSYIGNAKPTVTVCYCRVSKRRGLVSILERVHAGDKLTVVVAYRDRLARFGTELIETLLKRNGGELVVLNQRDLSPEEELTTDLIAILTVFGARVNGLRRYRKEIKEDTTLPGRDPED